MRDITIDDRSVGQGYPTFVIAEAGINHNGNLETALEMVEEAARSGADAIKFQTYSTEKRVPKDSPIFELLKTCELDEKAHWELQGFSQDKKIIFMSTAFDEESVELLANMNVPVIKVASFDIVNLNLLRIIADTRIPVVISTGMADTDEVERGVGVFERDGIPFALLHCISAYPAEERDANLRAMSTMRERFKHFTLDRQLDGPDQKLSVEPEGLKSMVAAIREAEIILGSKKVTLHLSEEGTVPYRRFSD
jgi:sialic acid synthase SpsE